MDKVFFTFKTPQLVKSLFQEPVVSDHLRKVTEISNRK